MGAPPLLALHYHPLLLLLTHCKTLKQIQSIHTQLTTLGLTSLHPYPTLASLLYSFTTLHPLPHPSSISYPLSLFSHLPSPSTFPHNLLIRAHTLLSLPSSALLLFACMRRLSIPPDLHTFPFALKACHLLAHVQFGRALHSQALKFGFYADVFVVNNLVGVYAASCNSHCMRDAWRVFDEAPSRDIVSYNTLIDGFVKAGEIFVARKLFEEMPVRDVVSWGTLLAGYSRMNMFDEALVLFDQMTALQCKPDDVALVSALSCCAQLGALDRGRAIHEFISKNRVRLNVYLSTGLVDMYAKCGCIGVAREIFESSADKNLFTWNAIIVGLAMHGYGELSVDYFNRMLKAGVRLDGVSFLGVLVGCSHAGLTDLARKLFDEMESVYRVERELKHYGCMADLLGRAGLIKEAMEMIEGMPMDGDVYVWGSLLGGCRIHGNVDVAEVAAEHLLKLNPEDSGIYSIMANIYASAKRWEDVSRMRRLMDERKVRKNTALSSVEVDKVSIG